jgi:hypothetical protein
VGSRVGKEAPAPEPLIPSFSAGEKGLLIEETSHLPAAARMLELAQRLRLDLPNALPRHRELLPNLLQRVIYVSTRDAIKT